MANCAQCGKEEHWYRPLHVSGGPNHSLAFCDDSCLKAYRARIDREAKARRKAEQEAVRQAELAARQARELEEKKRPFIEAIAANTKDPTGYLELADFLLAEAGLTEPLGVSWWRYLGHKWRYVGHKLYWLSDGNTIIENPIPHSHIELFEAATEHYLKAIALIVRDPYDSGRAKLAYGILCLLTQQQEGVTYYYCRQAEKDLKKHLRAYPEDINALEMLQLAVQFGPGSDTSKEERLAAIAAQIKEVEVRIKLGASPLSSIRPPGEPEPPYPENWNRLAEQVKRRDGYRCSECGASGVELHTHHIVPLSSGGSNDLDNLTTLCRDCHGQIHPRMGDARV